VTKVFALYGRLVCGWLGAVWACARGWRCKGWRCTEGVVDTRYSAATLTGTGARVKHRRWLGVVTGISAAI